MSDHTEIENAQLAQLNDLYEQRFALETEPDSQENMTRRALITQQITALEAMIYG